MNLKKLLRQNYLQVLLVCAAFFLMTVIGSIYVNNILQKESLATVTATLNETEQTIRAYLREPMVAFVTIHKTVQDLLDKGESLETVRDYLVRTTGLLTTGDRHVKGLSLIYGYIRGEMVLGSDVDLGDDEYVPQRRPWFQQAIRSNEIEYTAPYIDVTTGHPIISLAQILRGRNGEYYGVLALDVTMAWLMEYAKSLQFAEGGYGMILNQYLRILAHPQERYQDVQLQELGPDYAEIAYALRTGRDVPPMIIRDYDNTRVIVFWERLYNGWHLGVVAPAAAYHSNVYLNVFWLTILGILLSFFLSYILLRLSAAKTRFEEESKSKSSFLATMSHEIRTPMNAIMGIAQIQLQKEGVPREFEDALSKIYSSSSTLLGIINDILDLSKIETGKLELNPVEYNIPSLINDTVQVNAIRIGTKEIEFTVDPDSSLPSKLFGDELRLKQILNNLLSNAIKYTDKGHVKLSISHSIVGEDVLLRFSVEDTGQGLTPDDRAKLFSEYQRFNVSANRATEGTGLGLSITKRLLEMMDGKIEVQSEYGKGSVFTVEIVQKSVPCEAIGVEISENLKKFSFSADKKDNGQMVCDIMPYGKVLIVDDVDTNLYVAQGLLAPYKLDVEIANSGFAALELIEGGEIYDIIFMDHMMPEMDGLETTQKLREFGYGGVIVALTANAIAGNAEMFRQNGFDGFISKPIDIRYMDAVLNEFVRDRHPEEAKKYKAATFAETTAAAPSAARLKLLEIFRRDAEKAVAVLKETTLSGDIKLFTITTHAMKSALANIWSQAETALEETDSGGGAPPSALRMSQAAAALEEAGRCGDMDYISANTGSFIKTLEELIERLKSADENSKGAIPVVDDDDIVEDTAYLAEHLAAIKTACENFDNTAVYKTLDLLEEKIWKTKTTEVIKSIRELVYVTSDFEEAAKLVEMTLNTFNSAGAE
ncbi:MAG: response regulator [Chitinispirillales bacterium]|nr:response regulator [Chitinispirillales bacterium]